MNPKLEVDDQGTKRYYVSGLLHREDGPAVEWYDGTKSWFLNGVFQKLERPNYMIDLEKFKQTIDERNKLSEKKLHEKKLEKTVSCLNEEIERYKRAFYEARRKLDDAETALIEAREAARKAQDELTEYRRTQIGETSLEDHHTAQVEAFRKRMPESMKAIENEKPLQYKTISDLNTLPNWTK